MTSRNIMAMKQIAFTKGRKPVAKLIPIGSAESASLIGALKGRLKIKGDILSTKTRRNAES